MPNRATIRAANPRTSPEDAERECVRWSCIWESVLTDWSDRRIPGARLTAKDAPYGGWRPVPQALRARVRLPMVVVTRDTKRSYRSFAYDPVMMATTHALAGVVLAVLVGLLFPEGVAGTSVIPVAAAALGGLFPDFDLYAGHRRTLHFPVYFSVAAVVAALVAVASPTVVTVAVALFLAAAALHSAMDALGGGLELKPWLGTSDRAVYSHYHGRWIPPRRWVRYDGAPEDLVVAIAFAAPAVYVLDGFAETGVLVAVAVSMLYVLVRKPMVIVTQKVVDALPRGLVDRLPARFVEDFQ